MKPLLVVLLTMLFGCRSSHGITSQAGENHDGGSTARTQLSSQFERMKSLQIHFRHLRDRLDEKLNEQQSRIESLLSQNYLDLLRSDEPIIGLFFEEFENRQLFIEGQQVCRTLITLESIDDKLLRIVPLIDHAELWLETNPRFVECTSASLLEAELIIAEMLRVTGNLPSIPCIPDYQITSILNQQLARLRDQIDRAEREASERARIHELAREQARAKEERERLALAEEAERRRSEQQTVNEALRQLSVARVCDWPSIPLEVKRVMVHRTLGYEPNAHDEAQIIDYVDGCTQLEHPRTKFGSAKLHIEYAHQVRCGGESPSAKRQVAWTVYQR